MQTPSWQEIRSPKHVAHLHVLSVINTESYRFLPGQVVRVLDAGCGDCRLIAFLYENLPLENPTVTFEVFGFDVLDFWPIKNFGEAIGELMRRFPETPWEERIKHIPIESEWPYPAGFFDIILSNQVGEHLQDHDQFFGEVARCMTPTGFSVHLFPLKHVIMEWHILIPFAHRIMNYDLLKAFIALCSRFRLGIFSKQPPTVTLSAFSESHAEYVVKYTKYISYSTLLSLTKQHGLLTSMRYTKEFYTQKVRQIFSQPALYKYSRERSVLGDWLLVFFLRYVQGVTVFLEKGGRYHGEES